MEQNKKYICMGRKVDKNLITPIENREMFCKPEGGLWTSPLIQEGKYLSDWHEWCTEEGFRCYQNMPCSIITLKAESRVYVIDSHKDTLALMPQYEYKTKLNMLDFLQQKYIDYEKLSKDYDAIYLTQSGQWDTRWRMGQNEISLYGWDVGVKRCNMKSIA